MSANVYWNSRMASINRETWTASIYWNTGWMGQYSLGNSIVWDLLENLSAQDFSKHWVPMIYWNIRRTCIHKKPILTRIFWKTRSARISWNTNSANLYWNIRLSSLCWKTRLDSLYWNTRSASVRWNTRLDRLHWNIRLFIFIGTLNWPVSVETLD